MSLAGKWRIVEMPDFDTDYSDMLEPAYILFNAEGERLVQERQRIENRIEFLIFESVRPENGFVRPEYGFRVLYP